MSDLVGKVIAGRYRVNQFIGRGGMANVYQVLDTQRAATLAMKVLHEDLAEDQVFLRRFRREAQTLAKLKHPNIVRFYELGQEGELIFMLMEYVDGITLSKARGRVKKPFTPAQALGILQPLCSALHFAHQVGLIHCDIKPANIMIDQSGRVLLTDFGIARVTEGATTATMVGAGTPAYMSPEQVAGANPSPQTDVYSLGVVLYYLVTGGERPFTGEKAIVSGTIAEKVRWEQRNLPPPSPRNFNPSISPELETVILCCLAKDPKQRYNTVNQLLGDLVRAVNVQPETLPLALLTRQEKSTDDTLSSVAVIPAGSGRTRRIYWIAGGVVVMIGVLLVATAGWVLTWGGRRVAADPVESGVVSVPLVETAIENPTMPTLQLNATEPPTATVPPPTATEFLPSSTLTHTNKGYELAVRGGPNRLQRDYKGLAMGAFIMAESGNFGVYVSDEEHNGERGGEVYVVNFSKTVLQHLFNERITKNDFEVFRTDDNAKYDLELTTTDQDIYVLIIHELTFGQSKTITILHPMTNPMGQ